MKIISGRRKRPRRTLFYGQHGVGKTTWAAGAPEPIFLQCEEGLEDVGATRTELLTSVADVEEALTYLYNSQHNFKTVVVDTIDWLEKLIWKTICVREGVPSIDKIGFGKGPGYCLPTWDRFLSGLDSLRNVRGMSVVLLAHAKVTRFQDPKSDGYDRYEPDLHKTVCSMLQEWSDEVFFGGQDVAVVSKEEGFGRERTRAVDIDRRIVYTCEMPTHLAKRRIEMPDKVDMVWSEYQKHIDASYAKIGDIEGIVRDGSSKQDLV